MLLLQYWHRRLSPGSIFRKRQRRRRRKRRTFSAQKSTYMIISVDCMHLCTTDLSIYLLCVSTPEIRIGTIMNSLPLFLFLIRTTCMPM